MEIKFLKAGTGDSILIHHLGKNILIDGGNDETYLLGQITIIHDKGQFIDLLVITHHDDDHIKGIIKLLELVKTGNYGKDFIKEVIFNSPRVILKDTKNENELSYKQAYIVENLLRDLGINVDVHTNNSPDKNIEGLNLKFLLPLETDLFKYAQQKGAYLSSDHKCDWKQPVQILEKYIDDDSQDDTLPNRSSIVLKVDVEGKSILLTGDATPDRLQTALDKLVAENNNNPIVFDYVKLPHHGSYRSLSQRIIQNIVCTDFIICTNSAKYFLPNKRAILKLHKWLNRGNKPINLYFNYSEALSNINITDVERKKLNLKLIPNNEKYGFRI